MGYLITGVKDVRQSKVGDTVTSRFGNGATEALVGYREPRPMVYSGLYPVDGSDYPDLRDALERLQLNDAALTWEPETSVALGFGFRCGFLGLLHMEITRERLEREFDLDLISTSPNVVYRLVKEDNSRNSSSPTRRIGPKARSASVLRADRQDHDHHAQRIHRLDHGALPVPARRTRRHGLSVARSASSCSYTMPLGEIIFDFFDSLKSRTRGYASLDYEPKPASRRLSWSRSTSCCRARRSTRSPRSCTRTAPRPTATR